MTFTYDEGENELVGNNMFYEDYNLAKRRNDSLVIDVEWMMEEGRGLSKLREMRSAIDAAIEANE